MDYILKNKSFAPFNSLSALNIHHKMVVMIKQLVNNNPILVLLTAGSQDEF